MTVEEPIQVNPRIQTLRISLAVVDSQHRPIGKRITDSVTFGPYFPWNTHVVGSLIDNRLHDVFELVSLEPDSFYPPEDRSEDGDTPLARTVGVMLYFGGYKLEPGLKHWIEFETINRMPELMLRGKHLLASKITQWLMGIVEANPRVFDKRRFML